jgi:hypothetical protein
MLFQPQLRQYCFMIQEPTKGATSKGENTNQYTDKYFLRIAYHKSRHVTYAVPCSKSRLQQNNCPLCKLAENPQYSNVQANILWGVNIWFPPMNVLTKAGLERYLTEYNPPTSIGSCVRWFMVPQIFTLLRAKLKAVSTPIDKILFRMEYCYPINIDTTLLVDPCPGYVRYGESTLKTPKLLTYNSLKSLSDSIQQAEKRNKEEALSGNTLTAPPIGLRPREIVDMGRAREIREALQRYTEARKQPPKEWIEELKEIEKRDKTKKLPHQLGKTRKIDI